MPKENKRPNDAARLKFLADRMALLIVDLARRDCDYGEFCHDDFYQGLDADVVRDSKEYVVSLDFVRNMLRRFDSGMGTD